MTNQEEDISDTPDASEGQLEYYLERCKLYLERGFSVSAMAANDAIGRMCVVRKSDFNRCPADKDGKQLPPLFLIEFYNTMGMPTMFMEKSVPVANTAVEAMAWQGNNLFVGCADGSLLMLSPFSSIRKRFQICASPILAVCALSTSQLLLGSDSSEVLITEYQGCHVKFSETGSYRDQKVVVRRSIKFSNDEHIVSMAVSKRAPLVAVGMLNAIRIVNLNNDRQRINVEIPPRENNATIIWSLLFIDDVLLAGDSRGKVTIYNPNTGAVLKMITSHEKDILCLANNGRSVYASGVDYRIQVIERCVSSSDSRSNWATVGQRLFHENDVRAMACVGERWLVSGGAEHDFIISDCNWMTICPILKRAVSVPRKAPLLLMRYPHHLELWKADISTPGVGPKKLAHINASSSNSPPAFISNACISPSGEFIIFSVHASTTSDGGGGDGLKMFSIDKRLGRLPMDEVAALCTSSQQPLLEKVNIGEGATATQEGDDEDDAEEEEEDAGQDEVTALLALKKDLCFATGDYTLKTLNYRSGEVSTRLKRKKAGNILTLCADDGETQMLALTTNSQVLRIPFKKPERRHSTRRKQEESTTPDVTVIPLLHPVVDCAFINKHLAIFLIADIAISLVIYDLDAQQAIRKLTHKELFLTFNERLIYLSDVQDGRVLVSSNKSRCRILSRLDEPKIEMLRKEHQAVVPDNYSQKRRKDDARFEPFWGGKLSAAEVGDSTGMLPRSVILVGSVPDAPPSQLPMKIKRFERN